MRFQVLVFRAHERECALPVEHVEEIMRPLSWEAMSGAPPFVRGVSMIRGAATPVVDIGELLADRPLANPSRLVLIRRDQARRVGLLVSSVAGVRTFAASDFEPLPPAFGSASERVAQLAQLDGALLHVLAHTRLVPDEVWRDLEQRQP